MAPVIVLILLQIFNGTDISTLPAFGPMRTFLQSKLGHGEEGVATLEIDVCLYASAKNNSGYSSSSSDGNEPNLEAPLILSEHSINGYRYRFATTEDPLQSCLATSHTDILSEEDLCGKFRPYIACSGDSDVNGPVNISIVDTVEENAMHVDEYNKLAYPWKEQKRETAPMDGSCYLYWPVDQSEMFLYSSIPLSMAQEYQQREEILILYCPLLPNDDSKLELEVIQRYEGVTNAYTMEIGEYRYFSTDQILALPLFYDLAIASNDLDRERRSIYLTIALHTIGKEETLASFNLKRNIIIGSYDLLKTSYTINVHSMANSIHSRDHFGEAISMFLPDANSMVEVGVQNGEFAKLLLSQWSNCKRYILVDPWDDGPRNGNYLYVDAANVGGQQRYFERTIQNIPELSINKTVFIRKTSMEAAELLADDSLDIVYIDARHDYHSVLEDMNAWYPKIKTGGLLAGHDYLLTYSHDTIFTVKPAVDKFARDHNLVLFHTHDDFPTWMIFKS